MFRDEIALIDPQFRYLFSLKQVDPKQPYLAKSNPISTLYVEDVPKKVPEEMVFTFFSQWGRISGFSRCKKECFSTYVLFITF